MWKVIKWSLATLWTLVLGFAVFLCQNWVSGKPLPNLPVFLTFFSTNKLPFTLTFIAIGVLALIAFNRDALMQLEHKIWFYRSTRRLKPSDINPNDAWYNPFFIERPSLAEIVKKLNQGESVVLMGVPLLGKTRCAFEALKRLRRGRYVLGLDPEKLEINTLKVPRVRIIFKPRLILFFDDLQRYREKFSPARVCQQLRKQSKSLAVLATCHSGEEFSAVQKDPTFGSFVRQNLREIHLEQLSKEEERQLASHVGRPWSKTSYNGTPGSIIFNLEEMRQRLSASSIEAITFMRSLSLMREGGIEFYQRDLVETVARKIYERELSRKDAEAAWQSLNEAGFLSIEKGAAIPTHAVYIERSFGFAEFDIADTEKDLNTLWRLVSDEKKIEEIYAMASGYFVRRAKPQCAY